MRTIAIINQKGGCGKTTTAINLAGLLAKAGHRTLLVDMDPQSHCAAGLGVPEHRLDMDIGDAMVGVGLRPIDTSRLIWRAGRNLDLAPSRMRLAGLEAPRGAIADASDKEFRLKHVLAEIASGYDVVIIDCSPSIGLLAYNALATAEMVLIPVETSFFSLQGATKQVNTVRTMARRLGSHIQVSILPTIHDESNAVANDLLQELRRRFKDKLAPVVIRRDSKLREAASFGQTIHDYAPGSTGAADYAALAQWVGELVTKMPVLSEAGNDFVDPALVEITPNGDMDYASPHDLIGGHGSLPFPGHSTAQGPGEIVIPAAFAAAAPVALAPSTDRGVSRAEDVARRAQQFLRRPPTPTAEPPTIEARPFGTTPATKPAAPPAPLRLETAPADHASGLSPASRSLLGVRLTTQGVLFVQPLSLGHSICIAGDFNNWSTTANPMRRNPTLGIFEVCIPLAPGKTRYRLVIDGRWANDAYNEHSEPGNFNEPNNVIDVPAARGTA